MDSLSRALVVDDDAGLGRFYRRFFQFLGWDADVVTDPCTATRAFHPGRYQVVVCDVDLGSADGIEVARRLRSLEPGLRVVIVSGGPNNLDRARAAGFNDCLGKPFTPAELRAAIGLAAASPFP